MSHVHAVILAGGLGTRMRPLTDHRPKPLLPVAGVPIARRQLDWLRAAGITDVVLATSYRADQFAPVVADASRDGMRVRTAVEDEPLGTAGGLTHACEQFDLTGNDSIVVVNGDQLTEHDLARQVEAFDHARRARGALVSIHARWVDDARPFGLLDVDGSGRVRGFVEKPTEEIAGVVNAGTYVVAAEALPLLRRADPPADAVAPPRPISLEGHAFPHLIDAGTVVLAHRQDAYCLDVGTPAALVRASRDAVLRDHEDRLLDRDTTVHPRSTVTDGSFVGAGATVALGATVSGSVIMPGAHVGAEASVVDSVVGSGAMIGMGATVDGCAIGDGAMVPDHTVVTNTAVEQVGPG